MSPTEAKKSGKRSLVKTVAMTLLAVPVVLLVCLSLLLFTHGGNALLWRQAVQALPALNGDLVAGELQNGWQLENLSWQDPQVTFTARKVTLAWQPDRLLATLFSTPELLVQRLAVDGGQLTVHPLPEQTESSSSGLAEFDIPLIVDVRQINIGDFRFAMTGTDVALGALSASVRLQDNRLHIPKVLADNLTVKLATTDDNSSANQSPAHQSPASAPPATVDLSAIVLPTVSLPLPIALDQLTLTDARLQQGELSEELKQLTLGFHWQGTQVSQLTASAEQVRGKVQFDGDIDLSGHYPLNLNADVTLLDDFGIAELTPLKGQTLTMHTSGDLTNLALELTTKGAVNASLHGSISPFAPGLPLDLQLQWPQLGWPLSTPQYTASKGLLSVKGTVNDYRLALDTLAKVADQPATRLKLQSSGTLETLLVDQLLLSPDQTKQSLMLSGSLNWRDGVQWQGQVALKQVQPQLWLPDVPGELNGRVSTRFSLQGSQWLLAVPELDITGTLRGHNLRASGRLDIDNRAQPKAALPVNVDVQNLQLRLGENRVDISGQMARQLSLQARVDAPVLSAIVPELRGSVKGNLHLGGDYQQPKVSFALTSPTIEMQQVHARGVHIEGELSKTKQIAGMLKVQADAIDQGGVQVRKLLLTASGNERQHRIALQSQGEPVTVKLLVNGAWLGGEKGWWQGQLASAAIGTPLDRWSLAKPLAITANTAGDVSLSDQCWQAGQAKLCADASQVSARGGSSRFQLSDFPLTSLKPFLPEGLDWQAVLSAQGDVRWGDRPPEVNLHIQSTPGTISHSGNTPLRLRYQQLASVVKVQDNDLTARFDYVSGQLGSARINLAVHDMDKEQTLSGRAQLANLRLDYLQPVIPDLQTIAGTLSADTRLGGTLTKPLLFGRVRLREGRLVARQEMVSISNLVTELDMDGNKGQISGTMNVGEGVMNLSGNLDWQQLPPSGVIGINGENLAVSVPGILQLKASPRLQMSLGTSQTLSGTITIPSARLTIKELPKQAVTPSSDVVVITPGSKEPLSKQGPPFTMDVDVVLGDDIKIDAYGLKAKLAGQLLLTLLPQKPLVANGSIRLIDGRYHQFGQDLMIEEGNIVFSGPLTSPYLSVNAIRNPESITGDNVTVGVRVSGPPSRPEFSIYSDPTMPQQDQWSYLLRGRPLESDGDSSAVQSMLVGFGVGQIGGVVSSLGEKIGLSDVTLDTQGSGDDTQVTIGGNIAPGLRVQYGAGVFNSISEVKVRYELLPRLYVQAMSGLAQAVDLFYQFRIETGKKE